MTSPPPDDTRRRSLFPGARLAGLEERVRTVVDSTAATEAEPAAPDPDTVTQDSAAS